MESQDIDDILLVGKEEIKTVSEVFRMFAHLYGIERVYVDPVDELRKYLKLHPSRSLTFGTFIWVDKPTKRDRSWLLKRCGEPGFQEINWYENRLESGSRCLVPADDGQGQEAPEESRND